MQLNQTKHCDVLVIGSGIAGISAALAAAEEGKNVILTCKGKLFSGSSFYPGTWGLGLIGPANQADEADLMDTIQKVGCKMADPQMVQTFVTGISPAVEKIRSMGIKLRRADQGGEKEYIPCFDHKHRDWNGIEFDSAREVFSRYLKELHVTILSGWEILELVKNENRVCGAVLAHGKEIDYVGCGAVVLATGGYGSIFKYHLCTEDITGIGQYLALKAGCKLINMEFMQMMPGYIFPAYKTIFNEKTFRFTDLRKMDGTSLLTEQEKEQLVVRSAHGPFTSRLSSKYIDFALSRAFMEDEDGVSVSYSKEMRENPPEFVKVYFDWLKEARGITMDDTIYIGMFAHAANGGIQTAPDAGTGVEGLFAAGEVTGGMHGADRIGGLSTANGLVFGGKAGLSAARACEQKVDYPKQYSFNSLAWNMEACKAARKKLQHTMNQNAMVMRNENGLKQALEQVQNLRTKLYIERKPSDDIKAVSETKHLEGQLYTAECILKAALLRKESRGAHYRADYPTENPEMGVPIVISLQENEVEAVFKLTS